MRLSKTKHSTSCVHWSRLFSPARSDFRLSEQPQPVKGHLLGRVGSGNGFRQWGSGNNREFTTRSKGPLDMISPSGQTHNNEFVSGLQPADDSSTPEIEAAKPARSRIDSIDLQGWQGPGSAVPSFGAKLWFIAHQAFEGFPVAGFPSPIVAVIYPLIPWVGVMAAGYAFGALYQWDARRRRRLVLIMGSAATILFILLRAINRYGDPSHWSRQGTTAFTILSFLNTTKYPPSLLFLLMTLGPAILALAWFERRSTAHGFQSGNASMERVSGQHGLFERIRNFFVTFGRVPLFFYILQWYTAHLIAVAAGLIAGQPVGWQFASPIEKFSNPPPPGVGFRLWIVYVCWALGVLLLYPLCKWFAGVKARRKVWWLSYL